MTIPDILTITVEFLVLATVVGNPIRVLLLRTWEVGLQTILEVKWLISLATGIAALPLILLWLGLLPGLVAPAVMWVLSLGFLGANIWIYRRQLLRFPTLTKRFEEVRRSGSRWFLGLFVLILFFQLMALPGLFVTPGDDAKLYSLISQRFIEVRGIPGDWGTYAATSWYVERTHLLLPGFSSVVAFLAPISGFDIPTLVSVLASVFRMLTSAMLYLLMWTLTRRRLPSLLAMSVYGLLIVEPMVNWFSWGGMAELSSLSLLPVAAVGTVLVSKNGITSKGGLFWVSLVVGGMSLLHPFVFFYYLAFVLSVSLVLIFKRQRSGALTSWFPTLLGLALSSGPIVHAAPLEISIAASYSNPIISPGWTPVLSWTMTTDEAVVSLVSRAITVCGFAAVIFLIAGANLIRGSPSSKEMILKILGLWAVILFLLHENKPNGLFLVPFPLWYRIDPNRTFSIISLAVTTLVSFMFEGEVRGFVSQLSSALSRSFRSPIRWSSLRKARFWAVLLAVLLVAAQIATNATLLFAARVNSPIGTDDIEAFSWIRTQTPNNASFLVNSADAGMWIPLYTGREVILPFGVVTNYTLLENYGTALTAFIANPANSTGLQFMKLTGAEYVYSGSARIYGRPGFDPMKILGTNRYDTLYHQGTVWIFRLK